VCVWVVEVWVWAGGGRGFWEVGWGECRWEWTRTCARLCTLNNYPRYLRHTLTKVIEVIVTPLCLFVLQQLTLIGCVGACLAVPYVGRDHS
jgi:hypothetical protein